MLPRASHRGGAHPLPRAGESLPLGPFGGVGGVAVDLIAYDSVYYAPPGATREEILHGIGHGNNQDDPNSYEFGSPHRAAQYYGELRWTSAWPLLARKLGD